MKKNVYSLFLVLSLFIAGCGADGGTTTSVIPGDGGIGGNGGGVAPSGPVGTITVTFPGSPEQRAATYVTMPDTTNFGTELGFRVTASKYETRTVIIGFTEDEPPQPISVTSTTRTYFASADNTVPGSVTLKVPVDNGYLIEVVSFSDNILNPAFDNASSAIFTQMRRYGYLDNVSILETSNITSINLVPIGYNSILFTRPDVITAENPYSMLVTYNGIRVGLRNTFNFLDNTSDNFVFPGNIMDNAAMTYTVGRPFTLTAPVGVLGNNIYFQGQFYIHDSMLSDSEQSGRFWRKYRLNAPKLPINTSISQQLYLPGTINIIIN